MILKEIDSDESVVTHICSGHPCMTCLFNQASGEDLVKLLAML